MSIHRVFCGQCIEKLCGAQELKEVRDSCTSSEPPRVLLFPLFKVVEAEDWTCYMCKEAPCVGMLARRPDWELKLKQLFERDRDTEYVRCKSLQNFPYSPLSLPPPLSRMSRRSIALSHSTNANP